MAVKRTERRYGPCLVQGAVARKTPSLEIFWTGGQEGISDVLAKTARLLPSFPRVFPTY